MTLRETCILAALGALVIFMLGLSLNVARADKAHVDAFGDRAWIADTLKSDYQKKAREAGRNYDRVPVVYREYEIRRELAKTGCLLTGQLRSTGSHRAIAHYCREHDRQWLQHLNNALMASGRFPYAYAGQTVLAVIPLKTVHRVMRSTIKHADATHADAIFDDVLVPVLVQACDAGLCE